MDEYCLFCGEIIPEGLQVCPVCAHSIMEVPKCECKDCKDRHNLCHSTCPSYLAFRRYKDKEMSKRLKNRYLY